MSRGSFYKGTTIEQDARFKNKEKLLLDKKNFPKEFEMKLDITKVELRVIKSWVEKRITEILGFDDEFLINYIISLLENKNEEIDPKKIQILLTGFLDNETPGFMKDLWNLLLSAQRSSNGIPEELIREKEKEIREKTENKNEKIKFLEKMLGDKIQEKNKIKYSESKSDEKNRSRSRSKSRGRDRKYEEKEKHKKHRDKREEDKTRKNKKRRDSRSPDKKRKKSHKDKKYRKRSPSSSYTYSKSSRTPSRSRSRS